MAILFTADMHLRHDQPKCRTDNFQKAQFNKLSQVMELCAEHDATWVDAGDVFHKAMPPLLIVNQLVSFFKENYNGNLFGIVGNHDMPAHNIDRLHESALGSLHASEISKLLDVDFVDNFTTMGCRCVDYWHVYGASYDQPIPTPKTKNNILVYHGMIFNSKADSIPGVHGSLAKQFLTTYCGYDLIVTGHNHKSFHCEIGDRLLVNVGSLTRQTADQIDHSPRVFLWRGKGDWEFITLKHKKGVISREHLDKIEEKEQRNSAFVEQLGDLEDISLSFEDNVNKVISKVKPSKETINQVREAME